MKKPFLLILLLIAVSLAGCLPREQATPTKIAPAAPTATTVSKPTPTVALIVPTQSTFLPEPGCTVVSRKPTPGPTEESIYPPISEADHVKGPASARVSIIEYSDFQ